MYHFDLPIDQRVLTCYGRRGARSSPSRRAALAPEIAGWTRGSGGRGSALRSAVGRRRGWCGCRRGAGAGAATGARAVRAPGPRLPRACAPARRRPAGVDRGEAATSAATRVTAARTTGQGRTDRRAGTPARPRPGQDDGRSMTWVTIVVGGDVGAVLAGVVAGTGRAVRLGVGVDRDRRHDPERRGDAEPCAQDPASGSGPPLLAHQSLGCTADVGSGSIAVPGTGRRWWWAGSRRTVVVVVATVVGGVVVGGAVGAAAGVGVVAAGGAQLYYRRARRTPRWASTACAVLLRSRIAPSRSRSGVVDGRVDDRRARCTRRVAVNL